MMSLVPWMLAGIAVGCAVFTFILERRSRRWLAEAEGHHRTATALYKQAHAVFEDSSKKYRLATAIARGEINPDDVGEEATRH